MYLIAEECVVDEGWRIVIGQHHHYAADHLSYLVVDEALPRYVKDQIFLINCLHLEI